MSTKLVEISAPSYTIDQKPNYMKIGTYVDDQIVKLFKDGKYLLRAIGSQDHPKYDLDELADLILKTGTDKYDKNRTDVCHNDFAGYDYDIQAGTCEIKDGKFVIDDSMTVKSEFGDIIYHFFEHSLRDRGFRVRIDILMFYLPQKLKRAEKISVNTKGCKDGLERYLYKFIEQDKKQEALYGLVKIR
ncbi:hypothetical protein GF357_01970 [Candidatus Dojkabacteria bacterium]|nr:hypothetical protein [Candidatus Dojkabacteria bacterium]